MTTLQQTIPVRSRQAPGLRVRRAPLRRRRSRFHQAAPRVVRLPAVARRIDHTAGYYLAGGVVLVLLVLYLLQAAQVTAAGYHIEQLQSQQSDLQAEQAQLRYEEASLQAPARVQAEASSTGMQRVAPAGYVHYRAVALDLGSHGPSQPVTAQPFWARLLAGIGMRA